MTPFRSHFERLEFKFLIDERQASRIRRALEPWCVRDVHCQAGRGYPIASLYLDTPGLAFHAAKERGDAQRVKLRVRSYSPTSPATLEIKRRHSEVIRKTRVVVDRDRVEAAANGYAVPIGVTQSRSELDDFANVVATAGAGPTLTVRYDREAYESTVDRYARVTMDRHIEFQPTRSWSLEPGDDWCSFEEHWIRRHHYEPVLLEIKCESHALPFWMSDLVREHDLVRNSFSKYSIGVALTQQQAGRHLGRCRSLNPFLVA